MSEKCDFGSADIIFSFYTNIVLLPIIFLTNSVKKQYLSHDLYVSFLLSFPRVCCFQQRPLSHLYSRGCAIAYHGLLMFPAFSRHFCLRNAKHGIIILPSSPALFASSTTRQQAFLLAKH